MIQGSKVAHVQILESKKCISEVTASVDGERIQRLIHYISQLKSCKAPIPALGGASLSPL